MPFDVFSHQEIEFLVRNVSELFVIFGAPILCLGGIILLFAFFGRSQSMETFSPSSDYELPATALDDDPFVDESRSAPPTVVAKIEQPLVPMIPQEAKSKPRDIQREL